MVRNRGRVLAHPGRDGRTVHPHRIVVRWVRLVTGPLDHVNLRLVRTVDDAAEFKRWLGERRQILGVDTETGGFDVIRDELRLCQFGDLSTGWAIPWKRWGGV